MKAIIITIGDELLIGQTLDTNAAWIGKKLNDEGIFVDRNISIRDDKNLIFSALDQAIGNSEIILITGGLGPTDDDITKQALTEYFNSRLVLSEHSLERVKKFVFGRGYELNDNNRNQALVPEGCTVIDNPLGTAPVLKFAKDDSLIFSMPGVPFEMKAIMEQKILPDIKNNFQLKPVIHRTIMTYGLPEAYLAEKLYDWENNLPGFIKLAYLPSPSGIKLRLSAYEYYDDADIEIINREISKLYSIIPDLIFSDKDENLENVLVRKLKDENVTLSTAESCTGGLISSLIVSISGASDVFFGGIVAYDNNIKNNLLYVNQDTLEKYGAVSKQVVNEMAVNVRNIFKTDASIAVSGIAGPHGGTKDKPVGTVWISVTYNDYKKTKKFVFGKNREFNIKRAAYTAMHMLFKLI